MSDERTATGRDPIEHLADEFLARYRRGQRPPITEYVNAHPELRDEIRELFPTLIMLERAGPQPKETSSQSTDVGTAGVPQQLGEYRILREIGRGGMGIVYEAEQLSLGRHVALKVLPAHALLSPSLLTRFQNEARAAARLHHTNIVPVFGVGEDHGVHYYAMQFIQGHGLDDVLAELRHLQRSQVPTGKGEADLLADQRGAKPLSMVIAKNLASGQLANTTRQDGQGINEMASPDASDPAQVDDAAESARAAQAGAIGDSCDPVYPSADGSSVSQARVHGEYLRSVARMGLQVAEALAHAHSQGVLHRDIKPSNLLLDAYGVVWITDFGLAKQEGSDLTHSGDVVGTLRYLAPERFRGRSDARTDVYGLGVTLYELLTTRPAFTATDRHHLIHDIEHVEPQRPRRIEPQVPRDLETIVLKAMAKEPVRRYATANEMAADLRRFLDDQPIAARRAGMLERMWRWCARRPALASLAAALLLSLTIGIIGVLWQWGRAETNLKEAVRHKGIAENMLGMAQQEQRRAQEEQRRAEQEASAAKASDQTARKAVNELLTVVSENELLAQPGLQPVRLQLLTRALEFYEQRLAGREQDPVARRDLASSYLRLGAIKHDLGPTAEAAEAYHRAIALLTPNDGKNETDPVTTVLMARAEVNLGVDQVYAHDLVAGRAMLGQARERLERLLAAAPNDRAAQSALAMTLNNLGFLMSESVQIPREERFEQAIELHNQALTMYRRLAARDPKELGAQLNVATVLSNLARRNASLARYDEARSLLEECLRIRQDALRRRPSSLAYLRDAAATLNALGDVIRDSDLAPAERLQQAVDHYEQSREIQERLVQNNPAVLVYRQDLANTLSNLADLYLRHGEAERSLEWHRREMNVWDACLTLDPGKVENRALRALGINGQAAAEEKLGLYEDSLNSRLRSREAWREIQRQPQQLAAHRANLLHNLADLMIELGKQDRFDELCALVSERRELAGDKPADLLALSYDLERAFRASRRGAHLDEEQAAKTADYQQLAVQLFREAAKQAPREAQRFSRSRESMKPYYRLVELDAKIASHPEDAGALVSRSRWLRQLDDLPACQQDRAQALRLLNAQLESNPNDSDLLIWRAWLHLDEERWDNAVADATAGLAHQPRDVLLLRLRAWASMRQGQWQRAYDDFTAILQIAPEQLHYWPERCRVTLELGRQSEAIADASALAELAEKYPTYADSLVWGFMERHNIGRFSDATLALARQAAQRHPKDNVFRGEQGGVQYYLGQYQEAVENLQPNAADAPSESSASAGFWLAMSYHHLGELDKAKAAFVRAVRNWKGTAAPPPEVEEFLQSLWQEAKSLLGDSLARAEPPEA